MSRGHSILIAQQGQVLLQVVQVGGSVVFENVFDDVVDDVVDNMSSCHQTAFKLSGGDEPGKVKNKK